MVRITSRRHPLVQRCRRLALKREPEAILLDGEHLVTDALNANLPLELVLTTGARGRALVAQAKSAGALVYDVSADVLAAASPVRSPTGLVAIARWRPRSVADAFGRGDDPVVGLVDVQDPGNLGSAIRSADALGAGAVIAIGTSADPGGWKSLRGSMGSTFRLVVARGTLTEVTTEARRHGRRLAAAVPAGGTLVDAADLSGPLLFLLGNEGTGLDRRVVEASHLQVTLPMREGIDSLNVAVTAALLLWEARRQRHGAMTAHRA